MYPKNTFKGIFQRITEQPLWLKHVVYLELREEFDPPSGKSCLNYINKEDALQLYKPQLSFIGKKELETRTRKLSRNVYKILEGANSSLTVMEITISNGWNMSEASAFLLEALANELIMPINSTLVKGTALYLSGEIRLGEYFVKLGRLTVEQLDEALRAQRYIEESTGDRKGIGEILIHVGFVTKEETDRILLLKDDSKKRFIPESSSSQSTDSDEDGEDLNAMKDHISRLTRENNHLREQLRRILKIGG